ncbi:WxL protein peptidoglycan domain-containing protein [Jiangella alkaliphila]|uniref:DUF916 domain-containing protein n=1 Tax=Jiangella alkaliphila TaxID=419479 RepID=A0A1H2KW77_9ACTN|nr:DUF916 domain-containing protein [Jiangella alkaliphila]SDU72987.1 protein of unknown function [Jiangella alkaliphila]
MARALRANPSRSRPGRLAGALAAVLASAAVVAAPAAAEPTPTPTPSAPAEEPAAGSVSWSVQPSSASGPDGRTSFTYELDPGATVSDVVRVNNFSDTPQVFRVYSQDAINTPEGSFSLLEGTETPVDVGLWAAVSHDGVEVPPGGFVDLPFTLTVPANATPGDHAGGIVASLTDVVTEENDNQVLVENRVGTRIYLRVGGELAPSVRIQAVSASFSSGWVPFTGGDLSVTYELENTGNVRLTGSQLVDVEGPLGVGLASVHPDDLPELLPGQKYTVTTEASGVQRLGRVSARVSIDPASLNVPEGSPEPPDVSGVASVWAVPWPELVLLLVVVAVLLLLRRRSRGRRRRAADAIAAAEARGRAAAAAELQAPQAQRVIAVVVAGVLALVGLLAPAAVASEDPPGPGEMDVTVTVPSPSPTGSDTGAEPGSESGGAGGAAGGAGESGDEDGGPGEHPPTGADVAGWVLVGGLLVVFGTLMVRSMRRTGEAAA